MSDEENENNDKVTLIIPCNEVSDDLDCVELDEISKSKLQASKKNLVSHSPYFRAMFHGGFSEGKKSEITIEGVKFSAIEKIVEFTNGHLNGLALDYETVFNILEAAAMLQFSAIQKKCCDYLISKIDVENVIEILSVAKHLSIQDLYSKTFVFALYHFDKIWHSESFLNLEVEVLRKIVKSSHLNVISESYVYEAIVKWVKFDENSRNKHLTDFAKDLRASELSENQLKELKLDKFSIEKSQFRRNVPKYPCCIGRFKKSPYVFLFDPETLNLQPFLQLSGKVTSNVGPSKNDITAIGLQAGSMGTAIYFLGGEFSLGMFGL